LRPIRCLFFQSRRPSALLLGSRSFLFPLPFTATVGVRNRCLPPFGASFRVRTVLRHCPIGHMTYRQTFRCFPSPCPYRFGPVHSFSRLAIVLGRLSPFRREGASSSPWPSKLVNLTIGCPATPPQEPRLFGSFWVPFPFICVVFTFPNARSACAREWSFAIQR